MLKISTECYVRSVENNYFFMVRWEKEWCLILLYKIQWLPNCYYKHVQWSSTISIDYNRDITCGFAEIFNSMLCLLLLKMIRFLMVRWKKEWHLIIFSDCTTVPTNESKETPLYAMIQGHYMWSSWNIHFLPRLVIAFSNFLLLT